MYEDEIIYFNEKDIGKVLINNDYPFAIIKFKDVNFDENLVCKTKEAKITLKKLSWMN